MSMMTSTKSFPRNSYRDIRYPSGTATMSDMIVATVQETIVSWIE